MEVNEDANEDGDENQEAGTNEFTWIPSFPWKDLSVAMLK